MSTSLVLSMSATFTLVLLWSTSPLATLGACSISLDNFISQCFDGASVMSCSCTDVQQ